MKNTITVPIESLLTVRVDPGAFIPIGLCVPGDTKKIAKPKLSKLTIQEQFRRNRESPWK